MVKYLAIAAGVVILLLGGACYLLYQRTETLAARAAKLEQSNDQLTKAINAKTNATRDRAATDNAVRRLAPADKRDLLQ